MVRLAKHVRAKRKWLKAIQRKRIKGIERNHAERNERTDRFAML